jgi:hypothetical protein
MTTVAYVLGCLASRGAVTLQISPPGSVLHGNACPVVESILEPRITGEPSHDDAALAGALGDRSSATKSPHRKSPSRPILGPVTSP